MAVALVLGDGYAAWFLENSSFLTSAVCFCMFVMVCDVQEEKQKYKHPRSLHHCFQLGLSSVLSDSKRGNL